MVQAYTIIEPQLTYAPTVVSLFPTDVIDVVTVMAVMGD